MGELTLADYEAEVLLAIGNVPVSHPVVARGMHTRAINNAPNMLIRENPDLFPEHDKNTWTIGPTVAGTNAVPLPENLLILERVTCSRDAIPAGDPPSDWTLIQEIPLGMTEPHDIGLIAKPTSITGYPTLCSRKANVLLYNATTQSGFETYFCIYGTAGELPLRAPGETFRIHRDFDQIVVQVAAASTLKSMRQYAAATEIMSDVAAMLRSMSGVVAKERAMRPMRSTIAGMPR